MLGHLVEDTDRVSWISDQLGRRSDATNKLTTSLPQGNHKRFSESWLDARTRMACLFFQGKFRVKGVRL
jgi:hypothetical protein